MSPLDLLRFSVTMLVSGTWACASFRAPRPQPVPLTPALRRLYGCYTISFRSDTGGKAVWQIRLDSTIDYPDTTMRVATFVAPKAKWPPRLYWGALPAESLHVRSVWGVEGQGDEVRAAVRVDSLSGFALEYWSIGLDPPRNIGPVVGARVACPSSATS